MLLLLISLEQQWIYLSFCTEMARIMSAHAAHRREQGDEREMGDIRREKGDRREVEASRPPSLSLYAKVS